MLKSATGLFLISILATGCSLFFNTVDIEIPSNYEGWCYIIPTDDTSGLDIQVSHDGNFKLNKDGVVYVPSSLMQQQEDLRVRIYQAGKDVTEDTRYSGRIFTNNTTDTTKYNYIRFLVPSEEEKTISETDEYWRENYNRKGEGRIIFDSLLRAQKIKVQ